MQHELLSIAINSMCIAVPLECVPDREIFIRWCARGCWFPRTSSSSSSSTLHRETNRANREAIPSEKDLLALSLPVLILVLIRKNISCGVDDELPTEYRVSFCPEHLTFYVLDQKNLTSEIIVEKRYRASIFPFWYVDKKVVLIRRENNFLVTLSLFCSSDFFPHRFYILNS